MEENIIGRKQEIKELKDLYDSGRPEFVVIYGRRRVGKTFLVRELFDKKLSFYHTGLSPIEINGKKLKEQQLQNFYVSLIRYGCNAKYCPTSWMDAFDMLISTLEKKKGNQRQIIFIDEMPWMDTPRSGFITALEHFWNGWGANHSNIMLIVCGSATSWISDRLLNNHGGLYGRTTYEIHLSPFSLGESEELTQKMGIVLDKLSLMKYYMAVGGIPYYLSMLHKGESVAIALDRLCFAKNAKLKFEFDRLFASLFTNPENCIKIVRLLSRKRIGYSRAEIAEATKLPYGGGLTTLLKSLEVSDFIESYTPFNGSSRDVYYRLVDPFCLFYLHFMDGIRAKSDGYWQSQEKTPEVKSWQGLAFENLCYNHIKQIKQALGITGVYTETSSWLGENDRGKAQIDMLIDRNDGIIDLCEMKFYSDDVILDENFTKNIRRKISIFQETTKCKKAIHAVLVTTFGVVKNSQSSTLQNVITANDLFA